MTEAGRVLPRKTRFAPAQELRPVERLALALCIGVAALMCSTACFDINLNLANSKPLTAPALPPVPPSAQTLQPGAYRLGLGANLVDMLPDGGNSAQIAQAGVNGRVGLPEPGLEADAGVSMAVFQPYGMLRYQFFGRDTPDGPFASVEGGAEAPYQGSHGDYFGGLALGRNLDPAWEVLADGRGGSNQGNAYVEAGAGLVNRPADWVDVMAGLNFRFYGSGSLPNQARAGLSLAFGRGAREAAEDREAEEEAEGLSPRTRTLADPETLMEAGDLDGAERACRERLARNKRDWRTWDLLSDILAAKGDVDGALRASRRSLRLQGASSDPEDQPQYGR
jgi:hypothetical protein